MEDGHYPNGTARRRGQHGFWDVWYAHEPSLRRLCASIYRHRPDDAEDLLRAAMTRAWDHWSVEGASVHNPGAWLIELTRNMSMTHHRVERRRAALLPTLYERLRCDNESIEDAVHRRHMLSRAMQIIDSMRPAIREPFIAYALYGYSYADVAQTIGITQAAARERVAEARRMLAAAMAEAEGSGGSRGSDEDDVVRHLLDEIAWHLEDTCVIQVKLPTGGTLEFHAVFEHGLGRRKQRIKTLEKYVAEHERGWRKRFELANLLISESRVEEAKAHLRRVIELQPRHLPSALRLGQLLVLERRLDEAVAVYEEAQRQTSSSAKWHHLEGLKQRALAGAVFAQYADKQRAEHLQQAVEAFRATIAEEPRNLAHYHELGMTFEAWGKPVEALAAYDAALKVDPKDVFALARGHNPLTAQGLYDRVLPRLERAVELDPNYTYAMKLLVDRRACMGLVRGEEGKRTLVLARRLVERNPNSADALDAMTRYYDMRAEYDRSAALWRDFLTRNPDNAKAWTFYGTALERCDEDVRAAEAYIRSHALDPGWLDVYWRGLPVLTRTGRCDEARRWMKELAERFSNHWDACHVLAEHYQLLGDVEAALAYGRRSVELAPNIEVTWRRYGIVLLRAGRPAEALDALKRSWEMASNTSDLAGAWSRLHAGPALKALGRHDEAVKVLHEAMALARAGGGPVCRWIVGVARMELGDFVGAERELKRAIKAGLFAARLTLKELQRRMAEPHQDHASQ